MKITSNSGWSVTYNTVEIGSLGQQETINAIKTIIQAGIRNNTQQLLKLEKLF